MSDSGLGSWTATTALPTPIVANFAVAGTKVYYLAVPTLVAALSPSGISSWTPTFNPPGSWWASTCFAYENYLFCVTPGSDETYFVDIGQLTASSVEPNDPHRFQTQISSAPRGLAAGVAVFRRTVKVREPRVLVGASTGPSFLTAPQRQRLLRDARLPS